MRGQVKIYQKKLADRRRKRILWLVGGLLALVAVIVGALSYISKLPLLALDTVEVRGNSMVASSTIALIANRDISGDYLHLFSRRDFLLYPRSEISQDVLALPAVESADVSRADTHTLVVSVVERQQVALWCGAPDGGIADGAAIATAKCYFLDANGFVFAPAASSTVTASSTALIYRGLISGDPIGQSLMPADDFKRIRFFMQELSGLSVDPRAADLSASTSTSSVPPYMTVILGGGGKLVINTADDLSTVLGNIADVVSDRSIAPSLSEFLSKLDYMKLDVGNRVVYKLKAR